MILGVFPRTASQGSGDGNFKNLSGFYGSLDGNTGILSGEFNEQKGPNTPGVTALDPKTQNLSNRPDPSSNLESVGYDPKDDKVIDDMETTLTPPVTSPSTPWQEGDPITKGQLEYILNGVRNPPDPNYNYTDTQIVAAIDQARTQNLFSASLTDLSLIHI